MRIDTVWPKDVAKALRIITDALYSIREDSLKYRKSKTFPLSQEEIERLESIVMSLESSTES